MATPALSPEHLEQSKKYTRFVIGLLEVQAFLIIGMVYVFQKSGYNEDLASWTLKVTGNYYLAVALFAIVLFGVISAFSFLATTAKYLLDRHFRLIKAPIHSWLFSVSKVIALRFLAELVAAMFVFCAARFIGYRWWIPASLLSVVYVYLLFQWYSPLMLAIFGPESRFPDGPLRERLEALCHRSGITVREIYTWHIGERSTIGNAMVAGLGSTRRILISDTMCQLCTEDEVEAILAHELAHVANKDVRSRFLFRALTQILICAAVCWEARMFSASPTDFSFLPAMWLTYTVLSIYGNLALASSSRSQERAADLYAWKLMGTSKTFISGLQKLTAANLIHIKNGSKRFGHPSLEERMAAAAQFEASLSTVDPTFSAAQ